MAELSSDSPTYKTWGVDWLDENPLSAHLPDVPENSNDSFAALARQPAFDANELKLPAKLRRLRVAGLRNFFVPTHKTHFEAHSEIVGHVMMGYEHRNPMTAEGQRILHGSCQSLDLPPPISMISGFSGMGKSTLLTRILNSLGPQVVRHTNFRGKPFPYAQLLHLRINISAQCTVKTLCSDFGNRADQVLDTELYGGIFSKLSGASIPQYVHEIRKVVLQNHVGVLVLDEFQNLNLMGMGAKKIIAFLANLRDELCVPIVVCGTYKSLDLMRDDFTISRRLVEGGYFDLTRPTSSDDHSWVTLCHIAWANQWLRDPLDFSDEVCSTLYEVSQGITAVMIMVLMKAQRRALDNGLEQVDCALLRKVYQEQMKPLHPALAALRSSDPRLISSFDDLWAKAGGLNIDRDSEIPGAGSSLSIPTSTQTPEQVLSAALSRELSDCAEVPDPSQAKRRKRRICADETNEQVRSSKGLNF